MGKYTNYLIYNLLLFNTYFIFVRLKPFENQYVIHSKKKILQAFLIINILWKKIKCKILGKELSKIMVMK